MRKTAFSICKNKCADQLLERRAADQRLCFRIDTSSTIPLLPQIRNFKPLSSVGVHPGLYRTWSETPKKGFLMT